MPQQHRKRGRREQNKRKREDFETNELHHEVQEQNPGFPNPHEDWYESHEISSSPPAVFYGLLDEQEQLYFKDVDSLLEKNQFETDSDRDIFLTNIYKEVDGKELKLACSQSCSRVMERLIMLSKLSQTADICQKLSPHLLDLAHHRFASHCVETLLSHVARTLAFSDLDQDPNLSDSLSAQTTLQDFVLSASDSLKHHVGFLMSDPFGSHVLRVLLSILHGSSWGQREGRSVLQSRRKERISVNGFGDTVIYSHKVQDLPKTFKAKAEELATIIVSSLDATAARALATHSLANPVLQVLLHIELSQSSQNVKRTPFKLLGLLFSEGFEVNSESLAFANHLLYDTIGSRLLEVVVEKASRNDFTQLYHNLFEPQLGSMARNSLAGFVLVKVLPRLRAGELEVVIAKLQDVCQLIFDNGQPQIITVLVEQCRARSLDPVNMTAMLRNCFLPQEGLTFLQSVSHPEKVTAPTRECEIEVGTGRNNGNVYKSLLCQTMLAGSDSLRSLVNDSLISLPQDSLINLCKDRAGSRIVQTALTVENQDTAFRRRFVQRFFPFLVELSLDAVASHVVDALFEGTRSLNFLRERVAAELAKHEVMLRDSTSGRSVIRNWKIDLFKRNQRAWLNEQKNDGKIHKTKLEIARDQHAQKSHANVPKRRKFMQNTRAEMAK